MDERRVRELYDASYRRLVGRLTASTGSRAEAEDVVQEAFVRALARPRTLARTDDPEARLLALALGVARSRWRRLRWMVGFPPAPVTDEPSFERLVALARVRRRRRAATAAGVAVATVIAIAAASAVALGGGHDADGPLPVPPTPTEDPDATRVAQIVARGRAYDFAVDARGDRLTMWARGTRDAAWQLTSSEGSFSGLVHADSPDVAAASKGFLIRVPAGDPVLVNLDGSTTTLHQAGRSAPQPGDLEMARGRALGLADPAAGTWWRLPLPRHAAGLRIGTVADDGTVWATVSPAGGHGAEVAWTRDGLTWHTHALDREKTDRSDPDAVAGSSIATYGTPRDHVSRVAAYSTGAGPIEPLRIWAVSQDGGASWTALSPASLPFSDVLDTAVTPDGVLFVMSHDDGLWRSTDDSWTRFARVPVPDGLVQIERGPYGVVGRFGPARYSILRSIDDDGVVTRWTPSVPE